MLPTASIVAPLILPIANKEIDTLDGLAKNTMNSLINTVLPLQNNASPQKNQIFF